MQFHIFFISVLSPLIISGLSFYKKGGFIIIITAKAKESNKEGITYVITIYKDNKKIMSIESTVDNETTAINNAIKYFRVYVSLTKSITTQENLYKCKVCKVYGR